MKTITDISLKIFVVMFIFSDKVFAKLNLPTPQGVTEVNTTDITAVGDNITKIAGGIVAVICLIAMAVIAVLLIKGDKEQGMEKLWSAFAGAFIFAFGGGIIFFLF